MVSRGSASAIARASRFYTAHDIRLSGSGNSHRCLVRWYDGPSLGTDKGVTLFEMLKSQLCLRKAALMEASNRKMAIGSGKQRFRSSLLISFFSPYDCRVFVNQL